MKPKISFPGALCTIIGDLWKEHKITIVVLLLGLVLLFSSIFSFAQERRPLSQHLAETPLAVMNYPNPTLRLSDFRDRLLIIDFWATYCSPCLKLLPHYDSIQRQFPGKVQFLLATHEKAERAGAFLRTHHYAFPSVIDDTLLAHAFPHNAIPHEVWVWQGSVVAQTFGEDVTGKAIQKILNGGKSTLRQRPRAQFDEETPLYAYGNGQIPGDTLSGRIVGQSVFTRYNPGLNSIAGINRGTQYINVFALNGSPLSMYHLAYRETDPLFDLANRFIIELPNSLREKIGDRPFADRAWLEHYGLCYNLALPPNFKGDLGPTIAADLNRFFRGYYGIEAVIDQCSVDCLVLSCIPGKRLQASINKVPIFQTDSTGTRTRGLPLSNLVLRLAYLYRKLPTPLIDETGSTGPVDIDLAGDINNMQQLKKALADNGLQLTPARRAIPMVIVRTASGDHLQTLTDKP